MNADFHQYTKRRFSYKDDKFAVHNVYYAFRSEPTLEPRETDKKTHTHRAKTPIDQIKFFVL